MEKLIRGTPEGGGILQAPQSIAGVPAGTSVSFLSQTREPAARWGREGGRGREGYKGAAERNYAVAQSASKGEGRLTWAVLHGGGSSLIASSALRHLALATIAETFEGPSAYKKDTV